MSEITEYDVGYEDGHARGSRNERRRLLALAHYAEEQGIKLTAGWLSTAANLVMEVGPVEVRTTVGADRTTIGLHRPVRFRQGDEDAS